MHKQRFVYPSELALACFSRTYNLNITDFTIPYFHQLICLHDPEPTPAAHPSYLCFSRYLLPTCVRFCVFFDPPPLCSSVIAPPSSLPLSFVDSPPAPTACHSFVAGRTLINGISSSQSSRLKTQRKPPKSCPVWNRLSST